MSMHHLQLRREIRNNLDVLLKGVLCVVISRNDPVKLPDEISNDKPSADALLITERDRCLAPVGKPGTCGVFDADDSVSDFSL